MNPSATSRVKRRLDFGSNQCPFLYIPDLVPLDAPPQVPCVKALENPTPGKRRRFLAKQRELLNSAFEIDENPDHERYEALALSLGEEVTRIKNWFKNARSKKRRMIRLQKIAHTEQELERWRRRAVLRRSLNGTPVVTANPVQTDSVSLCDTNLFHVSKDLELPEQIFAQDDHSSHADLPRRNLYASQAYQPLQTPNCSYVTPAVGPRWGCYAPVQHFPPNVFAAKGEVSVHVQPSNAFMTTEFNSLFTPSNIFNTAFLDKRLV